MQVSAYEWLAYTTPYLPNPLTSRHTIPSQPTTTPYLPRPFPVHLHIPPSPPTYLTEPGITVQGVGRQGKASHVALIFILRQAQALCCDVLYKRYSTALEEHTAYIDFFYGNGKVGKSNKT